MSGSQAIIDIGSNSVRLVVYDGPARAPAVLFNEKVSAGLGKGVGDGSALDPEAADAALRALARFDAVARAMGVDSIRTVATAAVRDASDGDVFIARAADLGLPVELLSGEQEARASGLGVISAFPDADGIVGDLGGGSLELARVRGGKAHERVSLPLGVLRLAAMKHGRGVLDRHVTKLLKKAGWKEVEPGLPFWMVGGSWRALARLHMHLTDWPLPVLHGYTMAPQAIPRIVRTLAHMDRKKLKALDVIPSGRIGALGDAAALLAALARHLKFGSLIVSAYGLREGLIYENLDDDTRSLDPLIEGARATGAMLGRFPEHGDLLANWIAPLFVHEDARLARLRHTACLLSDVGWMANPELRAARGLDIALFGNWVGISAASRAMVAHALHISFGGHSEPVPILAQLSSPAECEIAAAWGHAMRLGQRLSGGVAGPLEISSLSIDAEAVTLHLPAEHALLYGETVERRHRQLATALGRLARLDC